VKRCRFPLYFHNFQLVSRSVLYCNQSQCLVLFKFVTSNLSFTSGKYGIFKESRLRLNYQRKKMILFFYLTIPESVLLLSCVCFFPFYSHFCDISAKYNKCKYLCSAFIFVFHENVSV